MSNIEERCRLIVSCVLGTQETSQIINAFEGGDIACLLLDPGEDADKAEQGQCDDVVVAAQARDIAVLFTRDTPLIGRCGADGIVTSTNSEELKGAIARFSPHKMVGCVNVKDRHRALECGEANPDFIMFGKPGGDIKPNAHPKNLALAEWWSNMVEIPCAVMGGNTLESALEVALSGAEFVVMQSAIFDGEAQPSDQVEKINKQLDAHAPRFEDEA